MQHRAAPTYDVTPWRNTRMNEPVRTADGIDPVEPARTRPAGPGAAEAQPDSLSTGDLAVDEALGRLAELDERPVADHAEMYEDIHRSLRDALDGATSGRTAGPGGQDG